MNQPSSTDYSAEMARQRHAARMKRKKAVIDARIEAAQTDCGVLVVTTGNGKGKSSSGFGMVARALGHGLRVGVVQFIKGAIESGEEKFFRRFPREVVWHTVGAGYTWNTQDRAADIAMAEAGWELARELLSDPGIDLVLLDELNIVLKHRYLDVRQVIEDIAARPLHQHVIVTGRAAPKALIAVADTVTDMTLEKHAFASGIKAQPGIEW